MRPTWHMAHSTWHGLPARGSACVLCILNFGASAPGQVELRGGEQTPAGDVVAVTDEGVGLGASGAAAGGAPALVIGWDWVKVVRGPMSAKAAPFAPSADDAWRARTRLERGDLIDDVKIFV